MYHIDTACMRLMCVYMHIYIYISLHENIDFYRLISMRHPSGTLYFFYGLIRKHWKTKAHMRCALSKKLSKNIDPSPIRSDLLKFSSISPPKTNANINGGMGNL